MNLDVARSGKNVNDRFGHILGLEDLETRVGLASLIGITEVDAMELGLDEARADRRDADSAPEHT